MVKFKRFNFKPVKFIKATCSLKDQKDFIGIMNVYLVKPSYQPSVLLSSGLMLMHPLGTNFWEYIAFAKTPTLIQNGEALMNTFKNATKKMNKFSASNFVSFVVKRKKPVRPEQVDYLHQ